MHILTMEVAIRRPKVAGNTHKNAHTIFVAVVDQKHSRLSEHLL